MQGSLKDMSVTDLIQHTCLDQKTARLELESAGQVANLYFKDGHVRHAQWGNLAGEEVIYRIIGWEDGAFRLHAGNEAPDVSITRPWSSLLLEAARRMDEEQSKPEVPNFIQQEKKNMAISTRKKSEILADLLRELLEESSDIEGAAVVGTDGLVYSANVPQRALDENMVGAASAAVLGLSKRSIQQLKRGNFSQTLIQGDDGNIIVAGLNDMTMFIGLTPRNVNLGMAFAETRTMISRLKEIL